ncbi:hypothetical protein [Nocardioides pelophilus]|uniref:hypothetical protein n=1 Tax=Nocardioides pelophilus TaxID=2172019 RepID=UPI0016036299|nr:hypothetical protein [Nocardioides pelophilus]
MAPKTPSLDITLVTKNLRALQGALEHSLTIQRTRVQEIVDELVSRGSLSRADADGLLNQLLTSSKDYSQALLQVLDSVTAEARKSIGAGIAPVMATAGKLADSVRQVGKTSGRTSRSSAVAPKAAAKPAAPSAAAPAEPIPGYAGLTVAEIRPRLTGLSPSQLRKVRDLELAGEARKSVLGQIDQLLAARS